MILDLSNVNSFEERKRIINAFINLYKEDIMGEEDLTIKLAKQKLKELEEIEAAKSLVRELHNKRITNKEKDPISKDDIINLRIDLENNRI